MKVGILGTGRVGAALAGAMKEAGHDVVLGSRDASGATSSPVDGVAVVDHAGAARHGDVVVLAVPADAAGELVASLGDLAGRILVDATNRLGPRPEGAPATMAELVAAAAAGARVVKAFNTVGSAVLGDAGFDGGRPFLPVCGDDQEAVDAVVDLAGSIGFEAVAAGGLDMAAATERFAELWIALAYRQGWGGDFSFGVLRR